MGIVGVTKTMAREWGRLNINVNAVAYGFIETRLTAAKDVAAKARWTANRSRWAFRKRCGNAPRP
jgi:NAD(P)-dependent dehydrogenase (short-subunit alcohol dehydrogenase family)